MPCGPTPPPFFRPCHLVELSCAGKLTLLVDSTSFRLSAPSLGQSRSPVVANALRVLRHALGGFLPEQILQRLRGRRSSRSAVWSPEADDALDPLGGCRGQQCS